MTGVVILLLSIALESVVAWQFIHSTADYQTEITMIITGHLLASLLCAVGMFLLVPSPYRKSRWQTITVFFLPAFTIPVLGHIGSIVCLLPALRNPIAVEKSFSTATPVPDLPFKPVEIDTTFSFAGGGLYEVLKHSPDAERRGKAVLSTQRMDERKAIPILQIALKDPVDDVRLLAYSILDQKENRINLDIKQALTELEEASVEQSVTVHKQLASLYWELVYLGLAQGDVLEHILKTSKEHLFTALDIASEDASAQFQLGRVLLKEGDFSAAEAAFQTAQRLGLERNSIVPYLAETAYLSGDFTQVPRILSTLSDSERRRQPIAAVANYWQAA